MWFGAQHMFFTSSILAARDATHAQLSTRINLSHWQSIITARTTRSMQSGHVAQDSQSTHLDWHYPEVIWPKLAIGTFPDHIRKQCLATQLIHSQKVTGILPARLLSSSGNNQSRKVRYTTADTISFKEQKHRWSPNLWRIYCDRHYLWYYAYVFVFEVTPYKIQSSCKPYDLSNVRMFPSNGEISCTHSSKRDKSFFKSIYGVLRLTPRVQAAVRM